MSSWLSRLAVRSAGSVSESGTAKNRDRPRIETKARTTSRSAAVAQSTESSTAVPAGRVGQHVVDPRPATGAVRQPEAFARLLVERVQRRPGLAQHRDGEKGARDLDQAEPVVVVEAVGVTGEAGHSQSASR